MVREESDALSTPGKPDHYSKGEVFDKYHYTLELLFLKVLSKLEKGNFKGTIRMACAADVMRDHSI